MVNFIKILYFGGGEGISLHLTTKEALYINTHSSTDLRQEPVRRASYGNWTRFWLLLFQWHDDSAVFDLVILVVTVDTSYYISKTLSAYQKQFFNI